jgi:hypothetical protein
MCAIYLKQGDDLIEMVEQPYDAELVLQKLLADHPDLLAGEVDGESRRRWLLVKREIGIADEPDAATRWSLDHLFLDEEGVPTLVEVKRSSNAEIRRKVVGQMLDYAANAVAHWSVQTIKDGLASTRRGEDPDETLAAFLQGTKTTDDFWTSVSTNLAARRLRLVFVADRIPHELRTVVEFLNEQMERTEVLALEVRQYQERDGARQTLVPRLIGQTEGARQTKDAASGRVRRTWTEADVVSAIRESQPAAVAERTLALYEFMRDQPTSRRSFGTGAYPSVTMWLGEADGDSPSNPVSVSFYGGSESYAGSIAINFDFVRDKRSQAEVERLAALMRQVPGVAPFLQDLEKKNYRTHGGMRPADVLPSDEALEAFKRALASATPEAAVPNKPPPATADPDGK